MKTAIVTGASGGIGGAIAYRLIKDGYSVFAQFNKNERPLDRLVEELEKNGIRDKAIKLRFDLTSTDDIDRAIADIEKKTEKIDLLVNCAGVGLYKLATRTSKEEWDNLFNVNIGGAQYLTSKVLDYMIDKKSGKIINVSSVWGTVGASMEVAYSASKAALIGYTKALAKEVAPSGITVNCVCPGVIDTAMNARFSKNDMAELIEQTPLGRIGAPSDVAGVVSFLASSDGDFITGQVITVDGGFTL